MNYIEDIKHVSYTMGLQKKLTINRQKEQVYQRFIINKNLVEIKYCSKNYLAKLYFFHTSREQMSPFYSSDDPWALYIMSILLKNQATYVNSYLWVEEKSKQNFFHP